MALVVVFTRIAAYASQLAGDKYAAARVLRLVKGETTTRSQLDADHLTTQLRAQALAGLQSSSAPETGW